MEEVHPMKWKIKSGFDIFLISEIRARRHSKDAGTLTTGRSPRMPKAAQMFKLADDDAALHMKQREMDRIWKQGT